MQWGTARGGATRRKINKWYNKKTDKCLQITLHCLMWCVHMGIEIGIMEWVKSREKKLGCDWDNNRWIMCNMRKMGWGSTAKGIIKSNGERYIQRHGKWNDKGWQKNWSQCVYVSHSYDWLHSVLHCGRMKNVKYQITAKYIFSRLIRSFYLCVCTYFAHSSHWVIHRGIEDIEIKACSSGVFHILML